MKKPPIRVAGGVEAIDPSQIEWLRLHGLMYGRRMVLPNDRETKDIEWGAANKCAVVRNGAEMRYVSFKHHKVLRLPNYPVVG